MGLHWAVHNGSLNKMPLSVIYGAFEFLRRNPRILHGVSGVPVAQLSLHGRDVAGLFDDVFSHGVPGTVRRFPFYSGCPADFVPDRVDGLSAQASVSVWVGGN